MSPPTPTVVVAASDDDYTPYSKLSDWMNILPMVNGHDRADSHQSVPAVMTNGYPHRMPPPPGNNQDALLVLLPLLIVLSTFLFLLLLFLICVLLLRRRRGILLRDNDGPVDMSREELLDGEGGFEGVESRWLESVDEETRRAYLRAKDFQIQSPPNSLPTDITLSQFLAIQEKGVSAWSFEPDYESMPPLLVHARTEITFLPDPSSSSSVQSNLPLPKLNEVYYWEVKMFDLPATTNVSVGLATKPYPSFRLPGHNRYSVAYHSNGDKSHNYPFTQTSFGPTLKEGDVLGVGYRPRSGSVFYTRNGRKLEDAFVGLTKWNLFPTVGADGPCSVHVNLGQSGFVFIEANVKKWGLAPSVGTLAPPPAYGAERGSILLEAGGERCAPTPLPPPVGAPSGSIGATARRPHRLRRPKPTGEDVGVSSQSLSARGTNCSLIPPIPQAPVSSIAEELSSHIPQAVRPERGDQYPGSPPPPSTSSSVESVHGSRSTSPTAVGGSSRPRIPELHISAPSTPESDSSDLDSPHQTPNPPTPNISDIHMHPISSGRDTPVMGAHELPQGRSNAGGPTQLRRTRGASSRTAGQRSSLDHTNVTSHGRSQSSAGLDAAPTTASGNVQPPAYSPLDAFHYPEGVAVDLPAEIIAAALEPAPAEAQYEANTSSSQLLGPPQPEQIHRNVRRSRRI